MGLSALIPGAQTKVKFIVNGSSPAGSGDVIVFDASIKEMHSRKSPPTEFPIENGNYVSDHIILRPFVLVLEGIISDTPIGNIQGLLTEAGTTLVSSLLPPVGVVAASVGGTALYSALSKSSKPSVQNYLTLLNLQASGTPFDVLTSLNRYPNMWITDISVPREAQSGNILMFTVTVQQLLLVTPQSVNILIFANPALGSNAASVGNQSTTQPNGFQDGWQASISGAPKG